MTIDGHAFMIPPIDGPNGAILVNIESDSSRAYKELQAENARLRAALELIASGCNKECTDKCVAYGCCVNQVARQALEVVK